jgi:hypothetical protein
MHKGAVCVVPKEYVRSAVQVLMLVECISIGIVLEISPPSGVADAVNIPVIS